MCSIKTILAIYYLGTLQDITKEKESAEKILYQAHFDELTGLPNRFLTLDRLSHALQESPHNNTQTAILFIDLDDFKKVNDSLGHEAGDSLLQEAAFRLNAVITSSDTVGRLGGDEFLMIVNNVSRSLDVISLAEKVIQKFRRPYVIKGSELYITASIGVALYPQDGDNASALLANADLALYRAKDLGRNTFSFYTKNLNQESARRLLLEKHIHSALSNNEFSVVYQPKINIKDGTVMGAEALVRWHNEQMGDILPDEFIPVAEHINLISDIGAFVLKEALKETALWQANYNTEFKIAVNLSPKQFLDPELLNVIEHTLKDSGVAPENLELEITEGLLLNKFEGIKESLNHLSKLGIQLAMDDFGTGYSSLNYLRSYPFNVLKIDKSFVGNMDQDTQNCELVYAAISMSHGLNLKVVAEGVETIEQLELLHQYRCDIAQGNYFSEPISAIEMTHFLENRNFLKREIVFDR